MSLEPLQSQGAFKFNSRITGSPNLLLDVFSTESSSEAAKTT